MAHANWIADATGASHQGLQKAQSAAKRGLEHLVDGVSDARDAVAPVLRQMRTGVANTAGRTVGYVREEPLRSAIVAAAVGTLVYAFWHLLNSRGDPR